MKALFVHRISISFALSVGVSLLGTSAFPFPRDNALLVIIGETRPWLFSTFAYAYPTLWCTTTFIALMVVSSARHPAPFAAMLGSMSHLSPKNETRATPQKSSREARVWIKRVRRGGRLKSAVP